MQRTHFRATELWRWQAPAKRSAQSLARGFTLVEMVAVLTIIMILAGIAWPRLEVFPQMARGIEAVQQMQKIAASVDARTANYPDTTQFATYNVLSDSTSNNLQDYLTDLEYDPASKFTYKLIYTSKISYCIVATSKTSNYNIYFSKESVGDEPGWKDNINMTHFETKGRRTPTSGGSCTIGG